MAEKKVEEILMEMAHVLCGRYCSCIECDKDFECDYISECSALYKADYRKQEWISVDERLPERWVMVLVCCDYTISTDFIASTGRWFEHIDHNSITHWMPLPEAPKMKGGAE